MDHSQRDAVAFSDNDVIFSEEILLMTTEK